MNLESKARINSLISAANATTGKADTDLTSAVGALIAGFGKGGSSGGTSGIYMAKITPAEELSTVVITHNLGTTDILFAALWAENSLGDIVPSNSDILSSVWVKTAIPNSRNSVGNSWIGIYNAANAYATLASPTSSSYWNSVKDNNNFEFNARSASMAKVVAGVTYTVIIMAASAFSVTEV